MEGAQIRQPPLRAAAGCAGHNDPMMASMHSRYDQKALPKSPDISQSGDGQRGLWGRCHCSVHVQQGCQDVGPRANTGGRKMYATAHCINIPRKHQYNVTHFRVSVPQHAKLKHTVSLTL